MEIQHFSHEHGLTFFEEARHKVKDLMRRDWKRSTSFRYYLTAKYRWTPKQDDEKGGDLESDEQEKLEEEVPEITDEMIESPICNCCNHAIEEGPAYFCETCQYFWLHNSCFLLPHELQNHPLHPSHPLILVAQLPEQKFAFSTTFFVCEECRDISSGFAYRCPVCQFNVDINCALSSDGGCHESRQVEMKSEIHHSSHSHALILFNYTNQPEYNCSGCEMQIQGLVYGCFDCSFYLHKSCAEKPQEIWHPYHSPHPLLFQYHDEIRSRTFICDRCRGISGGFVYQCEPCNIKLDMACALLIESGNVIDAGQALERRETEIQILHFSHPHKLFLVNLRKEKSYRCTGCESMILGLGYACLECSFYLHKSCAEMPREIKHSYHPLHPLRAQIGKYARRVCAVCKSKTQKKEIVYNCAGCKFTLHMTCTKFSLVLSPALKHNCHEHSLYYMVGQTTLLKHRRVERIYWQYVCDVCGKLCDRPSYICFECRIIFHLDCIAIPQVVFKRDFHMHSLGLRDPVIAGIEDDSKNYYCFACEEERNPRYHAYYCDQCPYTAHIECMVSEIADQEHFSRSWTSRNVDENAEDGEADSEYPTLAEYGVPQCRRQTEMRDFSNDHNMVWHKIDFLHQKQCYQCNLEFPGAAYTCEFCNISFHKLCAELPYKIRHPLHLFHPLILFQVRLADEYYKCDGCISISRDNAYYRCEDCKFILDIECASISDGCQKLGEMKGNATISIFSHWHSLTLANCPEEIFRRCPACSLYIAGPTYCCLECKFFIHESCSEAPREIQHHQFHSQHPLKWGCFGIANACRACNLTDLDAFAYYCSECMFYIHFTCANYQTSTLKYKNHEHSLFCFEAQDLGDLGFIKSGDEDKVPCNFRCKICHEYCNETFYRCLECDLNFHLECIPVPKIVKGACHIHPLTLMDSVVQDYFHEQYCYACEDVRNPSHAVYYCEKCIYIAHIGCVLNEADTSLEVLAYLPDSSLNENSGTELGKTSEKLNCEAVLLTVSPQEGNALNKGKKEQPGIAEVEGEEIERLEQDLKSLKSN